MYTCACVESSVTQLFLVHAFCVGERSSLSMWNVYHYDMYLPGVSQLLMLLLYIHIYIILCATCSVIVSQHKTTHNDYLLYMRCITRIFSSVKSLCSLLNPSLAR